MHVAIVSLQLYHKYHQDLETIERGEGNEYVLIWHIDVNIR